MASRLASLRNTLQKTTEAVVRDGSKVAQYNGPSIGAGTFGNYGSLPRPMPISFFIRQENNLKWALVTATSALVLVSAWIPVWAIPFMSGNMKAIKKADEEFGQTRYGAGKRFFL